MKASAPQHFKASEGATRNASDPSLVIRERWLAGPAGEVVARTVDADASPLRHSCQLTLYRCGSEEAAPGQPERGFFADVAHALRAASRFIYLAGWMFSPTIRLLRATEDGTTLGQLLADKASQGVRVCVLVWCPHAPTDPAATQYKDAAAFFEKTQVHFQLSFGSSVVYSHHQKIVVCDQGSLVGSRPVVAFVGGLDLAAGRWDTRAHRLFVPSDVGPFASDHYNGERDSINEAAVPGWPRQPWQDIHARVLGPVCEDLLRLFEARWRMELAASFSTSLYPRTTGEFSFAAVDDGGWSVQRLVSYPRCVPQIQTAYVHQIQAAQDFIYIENQFFIGGLGPNSNCVPTELAHRVAANIRGGNQSFHVVVVLPLHPEGSLDVAKGGYKAKCAGNIVGLQLRTIEAMLEIIREALEERQRRFAEWTQYLSFFSLAQREPELAGALVGGGAGPDYGEAGETKGALLARTRRYMVYVHSKFMCVDTRCCIVGSANINERSLSGERDSEVALLCSPTSAQQLLDFRSALLADHAGEDAAFWGTPPGRDAPRTGREIAQELRARAAANWDAYSDNAAVRALPHRHIVPYPIVVDPETGAVTWGGIPDCVLPVFESSTVPQLLVE